MKTLFPCLAGILLMFCGISSCSKKNESQTGTVTAQDLKNYYIVNIRNVQGKQGLSVIYFAQVSDSVMATWDKAGTRRAQVVKVQGNRWAFDLDGNGAGVFSYTFKKDGAGNVSIVDSSYKESADPTSKLDACQLVKVSDAPGFDGSSFEYTIPGADDDTHVYFHQGKWKYEDYSGTTNEYSYYTIGNGVGWKCEDVASGGVSMGVVVPNWNGSGIVMLMASTVTRLDATRVHVAVPY